MSMTLNECTPDEAMRYLQCYFATVDLVNSALSKYERLAQTAITVMERSRFRALALGAERDLELLTNQRRAFLSGGGAINPPSVLVVEQTRSLAAEVAQIAAEEARASAIIDIATRGLVVFNELNA